VAEAESFSVGMGTIPYPIIPQLRVIQAGQATPAEAMVGEAATAVAVAAINDAPPTRTATLSHCHADF
jgi:hypothetical protein